MLDAVTKKPIQVTTHELAGSYIKFPAEQIPALRKLLEDHNIGFWVSHNIISIDKGPYMATINLRHKTDPKQVQALLDAAP
jgi:hypothetical protein